MANSAALLKSFVGPVGDTVGGLRNKIINGGFDIWQRGVGPFVPAFLPPRIFTADRWNLNATGTGTTTATAEQKEFADGQTEVPDNPEFYIEYQVFDTAVDGSAASSLSQAIENVGVLTGQRVTVSFWMKGSVPGIIAITLSRGFGLGGSPRVINPIAEPTKFVNITTDWQKFVVKLDVLDDVGKTYGPHETSASGLNFSTEARGHDPLDVQPKYTGFVSLAQVQLEIGDIDDPKFEKRDIGFELQLCQRYYEIAHRGESNFGKATLTNEMWINYKVEKRIPPAINFILREQGPTSSHLAPGYLVQFNFTDGFSIKYALSPLFAPFRDVNLSTATDPGGSRLSAPWTADAEL